MRKFTFLVFFFFLMINLQAQDFLISFEGTGASTKITAVRVKNLTQGTNLTLQGNQALRLKKVITDIHSVNHNEIKEIRFYPNPMNDYTLLEFNVPVEAQTQIELFDFSGRKIVQTNTYLFPGRQTFRITGIQSGVYVVRVGLANQLFSAKLLCDNNFIGLPEITYLNANPMPSGDNALKSATTEVEMQYDEGDLMEFTATGDNYSTVIVDVPNEDKNLTFTLVPCTDADGKNYSVIQIGKQTWMAENLAYLPIVNPAVHGSFTAPFYYVYDYEGTDVASAKKHSNYKTYGVLYNYIAAISASPAGWHLPTNAEWNELENHLIANGYNYDASTSENKIAKSLAATIDWNTNTSMPGIIGNNLKLNNKSGFSALPSGTRHDSGNFKHIGEDGNWWTATERTANLVWYRSLNYYGVDMYRADRNKAHGVAIRCIKD